VIDYVQKVKDGHYSGTVIELAESNNKVEGSYSIPVHHDHDSASHLYLYLISIDYTLTLGRVVTYLKTSFKLRVTA